jgi:hypothetical protein
MVKISKVVGSNRQANRETPKTSIQAETPSPFPRFCAVATRERP